MIPKKTTRDYSHADAVNLYDDIMSGKENITIAAESQSLYDIK